MSFKKCASVVSLACAALIASTPAFAQDKAASGSGPSPYTDCGIGASLFPETKWAAVTSNVIWDLGITAIVSATASPQTCNGKKVTAALFIRDTYDKLAEETAVGSGEHLSAAMEMFGCAADTHAVVARDVRGAMAVTVGAADYVSRKPLEKAAAFYSIIDKAAASAGCSV